MQSKRWEFFCKQLLLGLLLLLVELRHFCARVCFTANEFCNILLLLIICWVWWNLIS